MPVHREKSAHIQHDWEKSTIPGAEDNKFFFGLRTDDRPSKYFTAVVSPQGNVEIEDRGDVQCSVELPQQKHAKVIFPDFTTTFVASDVAICNRHRQTTLKSIDINYTGNVLALTDTSGHFFLLNARTAAEMNRLEGHYMDVYRCRFFPSGLIVLSCGMDLTVRIWALEYKGELIRTFNGHTQPVTDLGILGRGEDVLSCAKDGTAIKWNCERGEAKRWNFDSGPCNALCVGQDHISHWFAVACSDNIVFVEDSNEAHIAQFGTDSPPTALAFDSFVPPPAQMLYVGDEAGAVLAFDVQKKEVVYKLQTSRGTVTRIIPHRIGIIVSYNDGTAALYRRDFSVDSPTLEFSGSDIDPITDMAVHENTLYAGSRDNKVRKYTIPDL